MSTEDGELGQAPFPLKRKCQYLITIFMDLGVSFVVLVVFFLEHRVKVFYRSLLVEFSAS